MQPYNSNMQLTFFLTVANILMISFTESMFTVTNGSSPRDGTMLIWKDGKWGAICQRFDLFTALTACKNMSRNM